VREERNAAHNAPDTRGILNADFLNAIDISLRLSEKQIV
jgi:hypothetical protein